MDYNTLIAAKTSDGSIKNWVNRSDIPSSVIVGEAEAWLWHEGGFRPREIMTNAEVSFSADTNEDALPSDFLDPIRFLPHGWPAALPYVVPSQLPDLRDDDGDLYTGTAPSMWTIIGTSMFLDIQVDEVFEGMLMYYAIPTALGAGNTTNFITNRYPHVFRHILLGMAYDHMKDMARKDAELQIAMTMLEAAKQRNDLYLRGATL